MEVQANSGQCNIWSSVARVNPSSWTQSISMKHRHTHKTLRLFINNRRNKQLCICSPTKMCVSNVHLSQSTKCLPMKNAWNFHFFICFLTFPSCHLTISTAFYFGGMRFFFCGWTDSFACTALDQKTIAFAKKESLVGF